MEKKKTGVKNVLIGAARCFPMAILVAIVGTICSVLLITTDFKDELLIRLVWTLILGFPLYIAMELLIDRLKLRLWIRLLLYVLVLAFSLFHFFVLLPEISGITSAFIIRELFWIVSYLLLITFIPLWQRGKTNDDFWQYNMALLTAFVVTAAFCVFLVVGIFVGLATVEILFRVGLDYHIYPQIWTIVVGIVGSTFFLSQIADNTKLAQTGIYRKILNIGQFVLIPMVVIYFIILYVYSGLVLYQGVWPDHVVSFMIIGFSVLGIFSTFFLFPLSRESRWVKCFVLVLYVAIIPQVGVLIWAVWFPLSRYGFTENRYIVLLFGVWLVVCSIYMLWSRRKDLRFLPLTLTCLLVFGSVGSWSAFTVSKQNQLHRLENIASGVGMFSEGVLSPASQHVSMEDEREISNIISYIVSVHGLDTLRPFFPAGSLEDLGDLQGDNYSLSEKIVTQKLQLKYYDSIDSSSGVFYYSRNTEPISSTITAIGDYDYTFELSGPRSDDEWPYIVIDGEQYGISFDMSSAMIVFSLDTGKKINVDLTEFIGTLYEKYGGYQNILLTKELTMEVVDSDFQAKIIFNGIGGKMENGKPSFDHLDMTVFLAFD
ncbi:DUF4153 domain-containing protein [Patescibacteria group bacterium]|nr:DUF4153 domain-containing protein [Patescibacteria group bacterium]